MLKSIRFKSFKSLVDTELPLEPFTLLIGTNGSGKTNAIEGLRFLAAALTMGGESFATTAREGMSFHKAIRSSISGYPPFGEDNIALGCQFQVPNFPLGEFFQYNLCLKIVKNVPRVEFEELLATNLKSKDRSPWLFKTATLPDEQNRITAEVSQIDDRSTPLTFNFSAASPIINDIEVALSARMSEGENKEFTVGLHHETRAALEFFLTAVFVIEPDIRGLRRIGYVPVKYKFPSESVLNLSSLLFQLHKSSSKWRMILTNIRELTESEIQDVGFETTSRHEVQLYLKERFGGEERKVHIELLSDGTIRLLSILAALYTVPEESLLIIEDVDASLHPSQVNTLIQTLKTVGKKRKIKVLVSSHNTALMDAIPRQDWKSVVLCYREKDTSHSKLIKLLDAEEGLGLPVTEPLSSLIKGRKFERELKKSQQEREQEHQKKIDDFLNVLKRRG